MTEQIKCPSYSLDDFVKYWRIGNKSWKNDSLTAEDLAGDLAYASQEIERLESLLSESRINCNVLEQQVSLLMMDKRQGGER